MTIKTWDIRLQELAGVLPEDISEDVVGWKFNDMEKCMKVEIDELRTALAAAEALSVRKILIEVVPGSDGMGLEVYAESLDQVVSLLTELSDRAENAEARIKSMGEQKPCAAIGWCSLYGATCECGVDGPCERTVNVYLAAGAKP